MSGMKRTLTPGGLSWFKSMWADPRMSRDAIAKALKMSNRTATRLAQDMNLGAKPYDHTDRMPKKPEKTKPKKEKLEITPWPDNVQFDEHPNTVQCERTKRRFIEGER